MNIVSLGSVDLTRSLLKNNISIVVNGTQEQQEDWLSNVGRTLQSWNALGHMTLMMENEILYEVWKVWDPNNNELGVSLSPEVTWPWENDLIKWAKSFTKRSQKPLADITISNRISVYRDWIGEGLIEYPEKVKIQKTDEYGQVIEGQYEEVDFDPRDCDYSKQLVARATARKGDMTEKAWEYLRDPNRSVKDLEDVISESFDSGDFDDDSMRIWEEHGIIWVSENGEAIPLLQSLFENATHPLFKKGLSRIYHSLGFNIPLELI